jgi:hypothetical protein
MYQGMYRSQVGQDEANPGLQPTGHNALETRSTTTKLSRRTSLHLAVHAGCRYTSYSKVPKM